WKNEKGDQLSGVVDVKLDGTIRRPDATGERIEKTSGAFTHTAKDGTSEVHKVDGSTLSIIDGHITRVAYGNGTFRDFEYGADGKLSKVVGDNGDWTTTDGKHWKNQKGQERVAEISVDVNGNYHVKETS